MHIVFLHGFSGSPRCGDYLRAELGQVLPQLEWRAPALFHHGGEVSDFEGEPWAAQLSALVPEVRDAHVIAYSLGARIALSLACQNLCPLRSLTLIGVNPGLKTEHERQARCALDDERALRIKRDRAPFFREWETLPLFRSELLPKDRRELRRAERLVHSADAMAASLTQFGLGTMTPLWDKLGELSTPVRLVAGEHDQKFQMLHTQMLPLVASCQTLVAKGAGHDVTLHRPEAIAALFTSSALDSNHIAQAELRP